MGIDNHNNDMNEVIPANDSISEVHKEKSEPSSGTIAGSDNNNNNNKGKSNIHNVSNEFININKNQQNHVIVNNNNNKMKNNNNVNQVQLFHDEILHYMFGYCNSLQELYSIGLTCRRWNEFIFHSLLGDDLFKLLYRYNFDDGDDDDDYHHQHHQNSSCNINGNNIQHVNGKLRYKNFISIHQCIRQQNIPSPQSNMEYSKFLRANTILVKPIRNAAKLRPTELLTLGILPPDDEAESLRYDHNTLPSQYSKTAETDSCDSGVEQEDDDDEIQQQERDGQQIDNETTTSTTTTSTTTQPYVPIGCIGYFGVLPLPMPSITTTSKKNDPMNTTATTKIQTKIAVWGDFNGLKVAPSWDALVNPNSNDRDCLDSISLPNQPSQQVMACALVHQRQYLALGMASGHVMIVSLDNCATSTVTKNEINNNKYGIQAIHACTTREISSILVVNDCHVLSGSIDGRVFLYPNIASSDKRLTKPIEIISLKRPIHAMDIVSIPISNGTIKDDNNKTKSQQVLCLGGSQDKVDICWLPTDTLPTTQLSIESINVPKTTSTITHVHFLGKSGLAQGTSRGNLIVFDWKADKTQNNNDKKKFTLSIRYMLQSCCVRGCVETTRLLGNLLFVGGGTDGAVRIHEYNTGQGLYILYTHPGRLPKTTLSSPPTILLSAKKTNKKPKTYYSAVTCSWICHERQSLISICRDGHVFEWEFGIIQSVLQSQKDCNNKTRGRGRKRKHLRETLDT